MPRATDPPQPPEEAARALAHRLEAQNRTLRRRLRDEQDRASFCHMLVETAWNLVFEVYPDGTIRYVNASVQRVLGHSPDALRSAVVFDLLPAEECGHLQSLFYRALEEPVGGGDILHMRHADGSRRTLEMMELRRRVGGVEETLILSARDITALEASRAALRESEARQRVMIDASSDGIFLMTATGFFACNPTAVRMFRLDSAEDVVTLHPSRISPPTQPDGRPSLEAANERIGAAFVSGHEQFEWTHRRMDGEDFPAEVVLTAYDYMGERVLQATVRDITKRKQAEEALQIKTEELDNFFTVALDLLCIADTDGYFRRLNRAWETTLGYERDELMARRFLDYVHPDDVTSTLTAMASLSAQQPVINFVNRYRCKDGSYRWIEWRSTPAGRRVYAAARDITEHRAVEEALREKSMSLEYANKELEAFSYSVSHDLRAPLRHINGFVELLEQRAGDTLDEGSRRYLTIIADSARDMGRLIDDLLVFSRMGRSELSRSAVDIGRMVADVIASMQSETDGRSIRWSIDTLPVVEADPNMLRLVIVNLLSNAVKYTRGRDEARIQIACRGEGADWVFHVHDNGVGFDMKYADKLFGVFQRLHSPQDFEGTGIGLANVRRIIGRHGGRTWAEAAVDEGATFHFTLPREAAGNGERP
jgi:PAS domain S-box-containing protein